MKRQHLRRIFFTGLYFLGVVRFFYWLNRRKQRILVFHHVIPDEMMYGSFEQKIVCTSRSRFAWLLSIVNKRFQVTTNLGEEGSAMITFDDGYRAALIAEQVLDLFGNKAYFFIPTAIIGAGPLWIDKIMAWFAYSSEGGKFDLTDADSRQRSFSAYIDALYRGGDKHPLADGFEFGSLPLNPDYVSLRFRGLTREEIDGLKQRGHKIGGHSVFHDILTLLSKDALAKDFEDCSLQLDKLYNTRIYAYPFGHRRDVDPRCASECQKSGFSHALMNEYVADESEFMMSRLNISGYTSRYEVEAALSGLTQWIKNRLRWIK